MSMMSNITAFVSAGVSRVQNLLNRTPVAPREPTDPESRTEEVAERQLRQAQPEPVRAQLPQVSVSVIENYLPTLDIPQLDIPQAEQHVEQEPSLVTTDIPIEIKADAEPREVPVPSSPTIVDVQPAQVQESQVQESQVREPQVQEPPQPSQALDVCPLDHDVPQAEQHVEQKPVLEITDIPIEIKADAEPREVPVPSSPTVVDVQPARVQESQAQESQVQESQVQESPLPSQSVDVCPLDQVGKEIWGFTNYVGGEIAGTTHFVGKQIEDTAGHIGGHVVGTANFVGDQIVDTTHFVGKRIEETAGCIGGHVVGTTHFIAKQIFAF